jgi:3-oxoacyl-[acyl-carrier-protein] synthase III
MWRPVIGAKGEDGTAIRVDIEGDGFAVMDGKTALTEAVPRMYESLHRACVEAGLRLGDLELVIPHQGSHTMINGLKSKLGFGAEKIYNTLQFHGNTSSSTIPLCLSELAASGRRLGKSGVCAFGGGYTFGAAILSQE